MEGAAAGESEVTEALYFGLVGEAARERGERPYGGRQKKTGISLMGIKCGTFGPTGMKCD